MRPAPGLRAPGPLLALSLRGKADPSPARLGYFLPSSEATHSALQRKPLVGSPGDRYEREADEVADSVMSGDGRPHVGAAPAEIQRACAECLDDEAQPLQAKLQASAEPGGTSQDRWSEALRAADTGGAPLPAPLRAHFEERFEHDFGAVRIHHDAGAATAARGIAARAYTVGSDVVFGAGEYRPSSNEGQRLLAHELTHVVQQGAARPRSPQGSTAHATAPSLGTASAAPAIQLVPATTPHGRDYHPGVAHHHTPSGRWADVQARARTACRAGSPIDCSCAFATPWLVMQGSLYGRMVSMPLARAHLNHYLSGGGADYAEDVGTFIRADTGVAGMIRRRLGGGQHRGHFRVTQSHYSVEDHQFAFGALDRLDFEHERARHVVHVWFQDRYEFHPVYPGYRRRSGDSPRGTNCVHAAAVEMQSSGAADFWMYGYAALPETLFGIGGLGTIRPVSIPDP